jgi:hypothetical protein
MLTIGQQYLELSWKDAWLHEARGPHGEWVRGPLDATVKFAPDVREVTGEYTFRPVTDADKAAASAEIQKIMDTEHKIVPGIVDHQVITLTNEIPDVPPEMAEGVEGETMPNGTIFMKPGITKTFGGASAKARERKEIAEGFWVPIDSGHTMADHVAAHELGHVVGQHLDKGHNSYHTLLSADYWTAISDAIGIMPPRSNSRGRIKGDDLADWAGLNQYAIEQAISVYGASSPFEMQAELWAEYTLNKHPRPPAQAFGKYVLSHLPAEDLPPRSMKLHTLDGYI